jgi:hypothetical protein
MMGMLTVGGLDKKYEMFITPLEGLCGNTKRLLHPPRVVLRDSEYQQIFWLVLFLLYNKNIQVQSFFPMLS